MSEIVGEGEPGWEMPVDGFRFRQTQLDLWFGDAKVRKLIPNVDYPPKMSMREIEMRLERAAKIRGGGARVWRMNGFIHIVCYPWDSRGLFPGQKPGEPPPASANWPPKPGSLPPETVDPGPREG